MNIATLVAILPVLGILAGLSRARYRRAPFIAAGVIVLAYALYIGSIAIWAANCWDCRGGLGETRSDGLFVSAVFFGLIGGTTLLGVWLGARLVTMLQRLRRTWRELRGRPHNVPNETPSEEKQDAVKH
jgi:hypothetical protein